MKPKNNYFLIPSNKPYSWAVFLTAFTLFTWLGRALEGSELGALFQIFQIIPALFLVLQIGFNIVQFKKNQPKFNVKRIIINLALLLLISLLFNTLLPTP